MARDLRYLGKKMRRVAVAVEQDVNELVKDIANQVQMSVVEGTPVDTGRARSNWVARVGVPFSFVYRAFFPGQNLGRGERANMQGAIRQAAGVIATRKTDQPIYISNNLPYIGRLGAGYSPQAASGYIQRAVATGTSRAVARFKFRNVERLI